ncbi:MAG: hypothetical protein KKA44_06830 [Alphaproteobacteria bacterium]|nr:hypothetical protein [Alphaproteobacteria bacterium]MBU0864282.1 hypothetical protein [Alphaproteobacteria bacterium]MBU1824677.1 hypothetical protein [Alphaproteobacteria bacterium]
MAELIFEIWTDDDDGSCEMAPVSAQGDKLRHSVSPNARRVHSFTAKSDFEAYQANYDWHGWGQWKAPEGSAERHFTEADAVEQRCYIAVRPVG